LMMLDTVLQIWKQGLTHGCEMSSTVQYARPLPNNLVSNSIDHTFGPQLEDAADKEKTRSSTRLFDFRFSEQEVSIAWERTGLVWKGMLT
jgi:hypothetical protein